MTLEEFHQITAKGESETLEFKTGRPLPEIVAKTVCGFLNRAGGRLLIGVSDQGRLIGVDQAKTIVEQLKNELAKHISPTALWSVEKLQIAGKDIVLIEIPEGMDKPYVAMGAIYLRKGESTTPANRDQISALIRERIDSSPRWERRKASGADLEDLDQLLIRETAQMASASGHWQGETLKVGEFLNAIGLMTNGVPTNAAVLLFGNQVTRFLPQARVRLLVVPEGKTGDRFAVDKVFSSCLLRVADEIAEGIKLYIGGIESRFSDKNWKREDRPLYPMTALREGVMNALVHRDYALPGSVTISISPTMLRIANPGGLPEGLTLAALKRDHPSVPRNTDVAHVCYLRKLIELIGRGTQRIVHDCREANLRDPQWRSSDLETTLTIFAPSSRASQSRMEDLNERQQKILTAAPAGERLRVIDVVKLLGAGVTDRTVRSDLSGLIDGGWLVRRGRGRSTSYVRTKKEEIQ